MTSWKTKTFDSGVSPVGLIGVGTMGRVILDRLRNAGYDVCTYDPHPAAREYALKAGARLMERPRDVAGICGIILLSLPGPAQIEAVLLGQEGILPELREGHVVIDLSTTSPATTKRMAGECGKAGTEYLDAPILGRPASIGRWVLPVGGDAEALERSRPVLQTFATKAILVGPSGAGHALKLLNQLMFATINAVTVEVMAMTTKVGLAPEVFFETVSDSGAATVSGLFREVGKKVVKRDFDPVFTVDLLCKDAGLALQMARECGSPAIIAATAQVLNDLGKARGFGNEDTSALVKVYENQYASGGNSHENSGI